ncbi:MAG: hypothetical protein ACLTJG_02250 [[Clostridium] innocuum]
MMHFPFVQRSQQPRLCVNIIRQDVVIELGGEDAKIIFLQGTLEERITPPVPVVPERLSIDGNLLDVDLETMDQLSPQHTTLYPIASRCGVPQSDAAADQSGRENQTCGKYLFGGRRSETPDWHREEISKETYCFGRSPDKGLQERFTKH